ncbi:hypothetical protein BOX15_Mlig011080g1, partial [Macrostomum lignano]
TTPKMSKAANTLVTTNNATYIDPRFMPGYRGHVPAMKFDYGETYGNHTAKYFQDYRSEVLNSSKTPYADRGGVFPTFYSHNPETVIGNRSRTRDRYLDRAHYELHNRDFDRTQELKRFSALSDSHRECYKDKTGTLKPVSEFQLPSSNEQVVEERLGY